MVRNLLNLSKLLTHIRIIVDLAFICKKSKGSGLFFGPGIGADPQIIAIELLIEPACFI